MGPLPDDNRMTLEEFESFKAAFLAAPEPQLWVPCSAFQKATMMRYAGDEMPEWALEAERGEFRRWPLRWIKTWVWQKWRGWWDG